jgi:hypothetical protein
MKTFFTLLLATLCAATGYGQTMKALSYNASNGVVAYSGTNTLTFTNAAQWNATVGAVDLAADNLTVEGAIYFTEVLTNIAVTRSNLGLPLAALTNTNVTNFRTAIGLGVSNAVRFEQLFATDAVEVGSSTNTVQITTEAIEFGHSGIAAATRTNLALGATNIVTFAGLTNNGDITINSTTASNGLLFIRRTNNEPFLGLANLLASNNTTISNETLFRVGVAEATNQSAQFGFRSTNTNGSGVAVFSVFGYNALMMVGADASTNAVIFSGGGTNNQVMTLIKSGATEFARPISFANATDAATTRTNLGLGLPALTNTSNVTMMRALAGSTNTNQPFSGTAEFQNHTADPFFMEISNGIILRIYE